MAGFGRHPAYGLSWQITTQVKQDIPLERNTGELTTYLT